MSSFSILRYNQLEKREFSGRQLLLWGIALRIFVFAFLSPYNCDSSGHLEHILFIRQYWRLPDAQFGHETWQPPLYYILGAIINCFLKGPTALQLFSLVTSVSTLIVAHSVISSGVFLKTNVGRHLAMLVVCFLPQFIVYSLQISNDSLATFFGFLTFFSAAQMVKEGSSGEFLGFALVLALGLLTKGQFLIVALLLLPLAVYCYLSHHVWQWRKVGILVLVSIILAMGCIKYVQNAFQHKKPFVSNMDFNPDWMKANQGTFKSVSSFLDPNVFKLITNPTLSDSTKHSFPLLMYGSFWYQYMNDSNFRGDLLPIPKYLGSVMYVIGIGPALLLLSGVFIVPLKLLQVSSWSPFEFSSTTLLRLLTIGTFVGSVLMLVRMFIKYDTWNLFQARYIFPTILGGFILCDIAVEQLQAKAPLEKWFHIWTVAFVFGAFGYFCIEIGLQPFS